MKTVTVAAAIAALLAGTAIAAAASHRSPVIHTHYDGVTNDLLTAGLGKTGLGSAVPPAVANATQPTAEELRRLAIYNNYRALVDPTPGGGYGVLYGPNVTVDGVATASEGLIAGDEYIAFEEDDAGGRVTMMVQVPDGYDPAHGCIVTAPSSGSRGVYGAIATAGEWGLKHGCAVAYTDKGSGTGAHDLHENTVNLIRGERANAAAAGDRSNFTANLTTAERTAFDATHPNRFAFKHAHSQLDPEKDWGRNVLRSIEFAFEVLNEKFGRNAGPSANRGSGMSASMGSRTRDGGARIDKSNTIVIASSVSNGGGASVRAVEEDSEGLIDGVAVGEPNVNPVFDPRFTIVQEGRPPIVRHSRPLLDYTTLLNVFQGCADLAPANAAAPLNLAPSAARCGELHGKGLLAATALLDQASEAQQIINDFGVQPEQNIIQPGYWFAFVSQSISVTYANAYGRFGVADNLCGYSFGATVAGAPVSLALTNPAAEAQIFGTSNGIPPTSGINLINDNAAGGAKEDRVSTPSQNLDGALCLRSLATGVDAVTGQTLAGAPATQSARIADGIRRILADGDLRGVPAIFVTGRNDAILPINFASRAYFGLNNLVEGRKSRLRYYEVTNAQHLDSFNQFPGYNAIMIPLHRYFIQAMDLMYAHLRNGKPLPPSQVVHTIPRGPGAPPITLANVPPIDPSPSPAALITFTGNEVRIPN